MAYLLTNAKFYHFLILIDYENEILQELINVIILYFSDITNIVKIKFHYIKKKRYILPLTPKVLTVSMFFKISYNIIFDYKFMLFILNIKYLF